ncbi:MAG: homoserine dehydrogenase [Vicinamibacterales bacterium]
MSVEPQSATGPSSVPVARQGGPLRVALMGFGTVGRSVARILTERTELAGRLQLTHVFNRNVAAKRADWVPDAVRWTDDPEVVFAAAPDVVVEVAGGLEPAGTWVRRALDQGASVVTANKLLVATSGPDLLRRAGAHGGQLRFEAAVGGGVPLIHGVREGLAGDVLSRVTGILNGTCNYVLSRMAATGESMAVVLDDARRLGYAEADPSSDVDGEDAAAKLVVLAGIAFGRHLALGDVPRRSIRPISATDFRYAARLGCTIRQIAMVEASGEGYHAFVGPALVPSGSSFGRNEGANNVVTVSGRYGGESSFSGPGAGGFATAVAVVSDLLSLADYSSRLVQPAEWHPGRVVPPPALPYYLRFVVTDRPGIVSTIASALARQRINLDAMLQEPGYPREGLPFVITVDSCEEAALRAALEDFSAAEFHAEPPLVLPMLGPAGAA